MRFEIFNCQRFKHALLVAQPCGRQKAESRRQKYARPLLLSAFCLLPFLAAFGQTKPTLLVIGYPTGHAWKVPQHSAYDVKVIDRDLQPRTADAYTRFAALFGVVGDPLFVIVTPHMEPIAASSSTEFLDRLATADRDKLLAEAGLAVRRYLLSGGPYSTDSDPRFKPGIQAVAKGPLYDHIGGGFFRCIGCFDKSTDDQARFALRYLNAWQETRDPLFAEVVRATLDYALADLQDRNGLFVAGANADSIVARGGPELLEGAYYVWQASEIRQLLGPKLGDIVIFHYGAKEEGNVPGKPDFYGKNVLVPRPESETRTKFGVPGQKLSDALKSARANLLEVRLKRPKPQWHSPIVTAYNAEMISALARASVAFDEPRYADAALLAARALRPKSLTPTEHALLTRALFDAYEATFDVSLFERAMSLTPGEPERVPEPVAALVPKEDVRPPSFDSMSRVIIAGDRSADDTKALIRAAREPYSPHRILFLVDNERTRRRLAQWIPNVKDIVPVEKHAVATFCDAQACRTPTTDAARLSAWLQ